MKKFIAFSWLIFVGMMQASDLARSCADFAPEQSSESAASSVTAHQAENWIEQAKKAPSISLSKVGGVRALIYAAICADQNKQKRDQQKRSIIPREEAERIISEGSIETLHGCYLGLAFAQVDKNNMVIDLRKYNAHYGKNAAQIAFRNWLSDGLEGYDDVLYFPLMHYQKKINK